MRITYVGELGWELHVPAEVNLNYTVLNYMIEFSVFFLPHTQHAQGVYDQLMEAGAEFGLRNAGMYAVDSLRIEKGYRHWGHELDTHVTPWEARLGFAVDMQKVCSYILDCMPVHGYATAFKRFYCM